MQCGDIVGLRGPFGRGFPFEDMKGHDILLVAGGLGIAPLRSLINNIHDERSEFGKVTIIYGSKTPAEVMFRDQFEMWRHRRDFDLYLTVDHPDDTWDGEVGLVTKPFEHLEIDASNTFGAVCGPPVMYRFVIDEMRKKNISYDRIYVQLRTSHEVRHGQVRALPDRAPVRVHRRARVQLLGSEEHPGVDVGWVA